MPIRDSVPAGAPVWIDLSTSDPQRAKDFYSQLFGWIFQESGPEFGDYVNCSKNGSLVAGMVPSQQPGMPDAWSVYLSSPEAKATADLVLTAGGQILLEPMPVMQHGTMAVVADPSGGVVGIWQGDQHKGYGIANEDGTPAWLELLTHDYGAAVRFYQAAFGWQTTVMGDSDDFRYTVYEVAGVQYAGIMDASSFLPAGTPSHWQVYFHVDDIAAASAEVERLGGAIVEAAQDTPYGKLAEATDPTGAVFKLMQPPAG